MATRIAEYYAEVQRREGLEPVELVAEWAEADSDAISTAFRNAFIASRITEQTIPIRTGSTNQSIGNQVADFFVPVINEHLQQYRIDACPGGGYLDKIFVEIGSARTFPFELRQPPRGMQPIQTGASSLRHRANCVSGSPRLSIMC
jgi:hypothetical protein